MTDRLNLLMISPSAPPKNTAESIQVRRILAELDMHAQGRLVTTAPDATGWAKRDATLELPLTHFDTQFLSLPWHRFTSRVAMSHRVRRFHVPDAMVWITLMAGRVVRALKRKPDIIYSRSSPMSAALLASKVQRKLGVPWVMHLSDPWAENPDGNGHPRHTRDEARCFAQAALITLTTQGQADHYKHKYPACADKIVVSPNMMPAPNATTTFTQTTMGGEPDRPLHLVFAGNLYGSRSPAPLVNAIAQLRATNPAILQQLRIDVYGNIQAPLLALLAQAHGVIHYHGSVPFQTAYAATQAADIALTIESNSEDMLTKSTLLSKVTDCLALRKPMLAITPDDSETARICNEGYGWAVAPTRPHDLAARIAALVETRAQLRTTPPKAPPDFYTPETVAATLLVRMRTLVSASAS